MQLLTLELSCVNSSLIAASGSGAMSIGKYVLHLAIKLTVLTSPVDGNTVSDLWPWHRLALNKMAA